MENIYMPFKSEIMDIYQHTDIEYTFRMHHVGEVKPGQFFEVSIPKFGECPISVSEIGDDYVDLTIRRVGKVTNELHNFEVGQHFFMRGPYGNGFDPSIYEGKNIIVVAGGSGLAPVKGVIDYFCEHEHKSKRFDLIVGFKSPDDILFKKDIGNWDKEHIHIKLTVDTEHPEWTGNVGLVTKYVKELEIKDKENLAVIIVGPPPMMKFTIMGFLEKGIKEENIWVSYERKMCCGVGKCGHCKIDDTYICLEGPVFNYTKAKTLID